MKSCSSFMAVMITDILLLDFFNTLGMPTSTTVSIVFELLGAAVAMSLIKIMPQIVEILSDVVNYINTSKATEIILGILLSVVVAFLGWRHYSMDFSRVLLSFNFERKAQLGRCPIRRSRPSGNHLLHFNEGNKRHRHCRG